MINASGSNHIHIPVTTFLADVVDMAIDKKGKRQQCTYTSRRITPTGTVIKESPFAGGGASLCSPSEKRTTKNQSSSLAKHLDPLQEYPGVVDRTQRNIVHLHTFKVQASESSLR